MKTIIILYFCIFFKLFWFCATHNATKADVGPYKTVVVRSERCKAPSKPYTKSPSSYFSSELYTSGKRTLLRGNLTVARVDPQIWLSSKGFILTEDNKYEAVYLASSVGCNGVLMRIFKFGLNVPHIKGCVPKGTYMYKGVDFNAIQQTWSKTIKYGSYLWRLQAGSRTSNSICWEYQTITTPTTDL